MKITFGTLAKIVLSVLLLVVLFFSFSNKGDFGSDSSKDVIAKVGDHKITKADLRMSMENAVENMTGGKKSLNDLSDGERKKFEREMLNNLINEKLMVNFTKDLNIEVSDKVVFDQIKSAPIFMNPETGVFDKDKFNEMLKQMGKTEKEYLDAMKESLALYGLFVPLSMRSDVELPGRNAMIFKDLYNNRVIDMLRVRQDDIVIDKISDESIKEYYDKNPNKFKTSEYRAAKYMVVNVDDFKKKFADEMKIDEKKVQEEFENQLKAMPRTEKRTFYNIVCEKEEDGNKIYNYFSNLTKDKLKSVTTTADSVKHVISDNLKISACHATKIENKNITEIPEALRKPAFDNVSEDNKVWKSEKTAFGYQVIILQNVKQINPDEIKKGIELAMKEEVADSILSEKFAKLSQDISDGKMTFDELSQEYNFVIKHFDYVDNDGYFKSDQNRYIAEDYYNPSAFQREVLNEIFVLNGEEVKLIPSAHDYLIISLDEKKPLITSQLKPLDSVKAEINSILIKNARDAKVAEKLDAIVNDHKDGMSLEDLEKKYSEIVVIKDMKIHNPDLIGMSGNGGSLDYFIAKKIFGEKNKDGDWIKLDNTNEIAILKGWSEEAVSEANKARVMQMIGMSLQGEESHEILEQIFDKLKEKYKIKIYEKNLD